MGNRVTFKIIPEVIPEDGEERVVVLSHHQTVFAVLVVRFPLCPVKPAHSFVLMRPGPLSRSVLTVSLPRLGAQPELLRHSGLCLVQQLRLQPVVDTRMIKLSHPGSMGSTENISVVPDEETSAARPVLLLLPAVRAAVGFLGQDCRQAEAESQQVLHTQSGLESFPH